MPPLGTKSEPVNLARRFRFGRNWQNYTRSFDDARLEAAEEALCGLLSRSDLGGVSFLDAGCGSGIVSLAARRLGATRIHSFDYDPDSVAATEWMRSRDGNPDNWTVENGSVLDADYLAGLGSFDAVYCWGVIHHTGSMWEAAELLPRLVNPGGRLVVAVYNDQGAVSRAWRFEKRVYLESPRFVRLMMAGGYHLASIAAGWVAGLISERERSRGLSRGMSRWHDSVDWVGGYPFEVARPDRVVRFFEERGLSTEQVIPVGRRLGCNQFIFRRPD